MARCTFEPLLARLMYLKGVLRQIASALSTPDRRMNLMQKVTFHHKSQTHLPRVLQPVGSFLGCHAFAFELLTNPPSENRHKMKIIHPIIFHLYIYAIIRMVAFRNHYLHCRVT